MRYLAIDYGNKRTGLAICDRDEKLVSPLAVIASPDNLVNKISEIILSESVEALVVGLPLNMDGSKGRQARLVLNFAHRLKKQLHIPVHFQDERLSSYAAGEKLAAAHLTKNKKRRRLDAVAAAEILDSFLEAKRPQ